MSSSAHSVTSDALTFAQSRVRDYVALLKPRVMSLVIFSGMVGLWLAPGHIHPLLAMVAVLCIALGSGASGAINMWYDRDIDAVMKRTKGRPIPAGNMLPEDALQFGVVLSIISVLMMGLALNLTAALLLASAILFYVFIYTMWLKRHTPQNIVIGGAAGAFPPMIGWAAVTGEVSLESCILFLIIFMWTPPHFWALALYKSEDYAKAGVPMLPVVAGEKATKKQILIYTILLVFTSFLPVIISMSGLLYAVIATLLNAQFLYYAWMVYKDQYHKHAPKMFGFSILYLFLLFAGMVADKMILGS